MNKQKLINNLESKKFKFTNPIITDYQQGYNDGINFALSYLKVLDEPTSQTTTNTPAHYQATIQPIELINAQNLNFNLGNVVKYVCRAGKKKNENILSDLEKAKNYINFEIERLKNE